MTTNFRPSGMMCQNCIYFAVRNCSNLPFAFMQPLKQDKDGTVVVKCSDFRRMMQQEEKHD